MRMIMIRTAWTQMLCYIKYIPDTWGFMSLQDVCEILYCVGVERQEMTLILQNKEKVNTLWF